MTRELVILITSDGQIKIFAEDMPGLEELVALIGQPAIDKELAELGFDIRLNEHLCG